jgi:hypothetical protein
MGGMVQYQHRRILEIKVSKESMNEINLLPRSKVMSAIGTKLPFAAFKTTSAFWGTAVEKCSL